MEVGSGLLEVQCWFLAEVAVAATGKVLIRIGGGQGGNSVQIVFI